MGSYSSFSAIISVYCILLCFISILNIISADDNVQYDNIEIFAQTVNGINVDTILDSCYRGRYKSHTIVTQDDETYNWGECAGFVDCPKGFYCVKGLKHPCPAGTFGNETKIYTKACSSLCPAGYYCPENTIDPIPCGDGNFCPVESATPTISKVGYYTVGETSTSSSDTHSNEKICEHGHYCINGEKKMCPGGTYGNSTGLSTILCSGICRPGFFCPEGSIHEMECGGDEFFCPEGSSRRERVLLGGDIGPDNHDKGAFYTLGGTPDGSHSKNATRNDQKRCPQGSYCVNGVRRPCPAGRYGSRLGEDRADCAGLCAEGFYCPEGSTKAHERACGGPSHFCPEGSPSPKKVQNGYFSYASPTKHLIGALGYPESSFYTAINTTNTTGLRKTAEAICDPGHYCVDGVRLQCPIGRYGSTYGLANSDCTDRCAPGYYCNKASKVIDENECGGSHLFCPIGTGVPKHVHQGYYTIGETLTTRYDEKLCELGMWCNHTTGLQTQCPAGRYGGKYGLYNDTCSGNCTGGYYCPLGSVTAQQEHCGNPKYYCPIGTPLRRLVDKGYHGVHVDEPPIYYDEKNLSTNEKGRRFELIEVPDTRYTTFSHQEICPLGSYCVLGIRYLCPAGRYGGVTGLSEAICSGNVSAGYFGPPGSSSKTEHECGGAQYFCPSGSGSPYPVSLGHYTWSPLTTLRNTLNTCHSANTQISDNSLNPDTVNDIHSTIYGYLTTSQGALTPSIIQNPTDGNYQLLTGVETTTNGIGTGLKLNLEITGGPINGGTGRKNVTSVTVHTPGINYKPDDTVTVSHTLLANTKTDLIIRLLDNDFDTVCKRYTYDAKYLAMYNDYGGEKVRTWQHICPPGSYCKDGHLWEHPPGRFGRTNGSYQVNGTGECQPGFYCPAGSTSPQQVPCGDPHVYCPRGSGNPTPVSQGYYTSIGWKYISNVTHPTTRHLLAPSDHGGSNNNVNTYGKSNIVQGNSHLKYEQKKCEVGHYCVDGLRNACPAGRYAESEGAYQEFCEGPCSKGYFCPHGSYSRTQYECGSQRGLDATGVKDPTALYCPSGMSIECDTATTITTFFNGKSQKYESVPGAYCPTGMTTGSGVPKIVKPGYYTVGGEHLTNKTRFAQRICPVGHYCTDGRRIRCPAGRYGGSEGLPNISCTDQCDAGYFCPQGSWNKDQVKCGLGTRSPCYTHPPGTVATYRPSSERRCEYYQGQMFQPVEITVDGITIILNMYTRESGPHNITYLVPGDLVYMSCETYKGSDGEYMVLNVTANHIEFDKAHGVPRNIWTPQTCTLTTYNKARQGDGEYYRWNHLVQELNDDGPWSLHHQETEHWLDDAPRQYHDPTLMPLKPGEHNEVVPNGARSGRFVHSQLAQKWTNAHPRQYHYHTRVRHPSRHRIPGESPSVYCPRGSGVPTQVEMGWYTTGGNETDNMTRSGERKCDPGYFCEGGKKIQCPPGRYGKSYGETSEFCSGYCPAGFYCPWNTTNPIECPLGTYSGHGYFQCMQCKQKSDYHVQSQTCRNNRKCCNT